MTPDHTLAWWQPLSSKPEPTLAEVSAAELYLREQAAMQMDLQSAGFQEWLDDHPEYAIGIALEAMLACDRQWRPDNLARINDAIERLRDHWQSYCVDCASDEDWMNAYRQGAQ